MSVSEASVINPVHASATKVRETAGLSEKQDTYPRGKAYPVHSSIPRGVSRRRIKMPRRPARVDCNRYISFNFTEGRPAPLIINLSLVGVNERYDLAVTCAHEIRVS
jgi:hypothetical protein